MILGTVSATRDAILKLQLFDRAGRKISIDAVLDTGFNHDLTLPPEIVDALGLDFLAPAEATVAGEVVVPTSYHRARILWDGQERLVAVLKMPGLPLLGMGLLEGHRVTLDVKAGGDVRITPLPS